jgi:hypothetical protein
MSAAVLDASTIATALGGEKAGPGILGLLPGACGADTQSEARGHRGRAGAVEVLWRCEV